MRFILSLKGVPQSGAVTGGNFLVTASQRQGQVEFVELVSSASRTCQLRNPWGDKEIRLHRDAQPAESLSGALLKFPPRRDERIVVAPAGATLAQFRRPVMN
jgi:alpha-L-fucosidase 2